MAAPMSDSPADNAGRPVPSRARSLALKLGLLSITFLICLLCMEIGVRIAMPFFSPRAQIPFQFLTNGVALGTPNQTIRQATPKGDYDSTIHFNEDGFRDSKTLRQSTEADWFALGDSYTLGWGVEEPERFSSRLEKLLQTNQPPARIFNIAIPEDLIGYERLLGYVASRGARVRHLIIGVCMENDLKNYTSRQTAYEGAHSAAGGGMSGKERVRAWLKSHSALYIAASYTLQKGDATRRLMEKLGISRDIQALTGFNTWDETVLNTSRDELVRLAAGKDAVILIIPSRNLWHGTHQDEERRVHEGFVAMVRAAGLQVVDPRLAIEAQGDPLACHFKTDPHWNARGHEIAALELCKWFQAHVAARP